MIASPEMIRRVIADYGTASEANRRRPPREGNVVVLSALTADEVMITADLHGNRRNFRKLCRIADLEGHPRRHLVMQEVCHGGPAYPDAGGCMSHLMLEDAAHLKVEYPDRFHYLLSNHELAELTDFPIVKSGKMLNLLFRAGMHQMYGDATDRVRRAQIEFLGSLPLAVRLASDVFISHSVPGGADREGFDAGVFQRPLHEADLAEGGAAFRLVWGRDFRAENVKSFADQLGARVLITGHEPCAQGYRVPNDRQIILDCCGREACYLVLPVVEKLSQGDIVKRIRKLATT